MHSRQVEPQQRGLQSFDDCGGSLSVDPSYCVGSPDGVNPYCTATALMPSSRTRGCGLRFSASFHTHHGERERPQGAADIIIIITTLNNHLLNDAAAHRRRSQVRANSQIGMVWDPQHNRQLRALTGRALRLGESDPSTAPINRGLTRTIPNHAHVRRRRRRRR